MKEYTDDELYKSAMIAGLELYGLPHPSETGDKRREFVRRAKKYGIDLSKYSYHGGSGLMFSFKGEHRKGILRLPISDRIKEEIENAGMSKEEFEEMGMQFDDQCEYIFNPSTNKGIDTPGWDGNLLTKKYRDSNGKLYTAGGWGIWEYTIDITREEVLELFS